MRPHEDGNYSLDEQHPPLPADVIELVIAARIVAFEDQSAEAIKRLDTASEAFADRVKWDDEDRRARSALAGDGETSDLEQRLRDGAQAIDNDGTSSQVGPSADELREAATLISQLRNRLSDLEGWKLVPIEATEEMIQAWYHELEQWGMRRNKSVDLVYEVFRHSSPDVVSPVVIESFSIHDDAERRRYQLEVQAAYRAMISASPSPPIPAVEIDGEKR